jgi:hypothetical protein
MSVALPPIPPTRKRPSTNQGQHEIAAASLAAGIIAAAGGTCTPDAAIALWRDMLADMYPLEGVVGTPL